MYTWKFWNRTSPINGCPAEETGFTKENRVYLIEDKNGVVSVVQYEKCRPYPDLPIEEAAQKQCDEMNNAEALNAENTQNNESEDKQNG